MFRLVEGFFHTGHVYKIRSIVLPMAISFPLDLMETHLVIWMCLPLNQKFLSSEKKTDGAHKSDWIHKKMWWESRDIY